MGGTAPIRNSLGILGVVLAITASLASAAQAAFPGQNGKIAFATSRDGNLEIYTMDADGTGQTNRTANAGTDEQPAWSPDGTKIAFRSSRDGNHEIYTMNADGTGQVNRTTHAAFDTTPAWSPDGAKIAFLSSRDGGGDIYTMNADGTGVTRITNGAVEAEPAWSPDGTKIAFTSARDGNSEIYTMNADGTNQVRRTTNAVGDFSPEWSPDGTKIAFGSVRDGNTEVYVMNADGTGQVNRTTNAASDSEPAWSPDGTKIAFSSTREINSEIFTMNADGTGAVNRTTNAAGELGPDWQPVKADTDGDSLPDSWEEDGIDTDDDGTPELDLPAMGADPDHKDIFIEMDFMSGHRIANAQIDAVTEAFEDAPVGNPDGQGGITLHVDNGSSSVMDPTTSSTWGSLSDQDTLSHQNTLGSDFTVGGQTRYDWSEFESLRQTNLLAVRRSVFHYVIAAHSGPSQRFAGISRGVTGGAADFIVAMHENCPTPRPPLGSECASPHPENTAATFMHELGHNLGLQHGGTDADARKPNYLSVMNYNFGFGLIAFDGVTPTSTSFELDYSRFNLSLNENSLDEEVGFGIDSGPVSAFKTIFTCPNGTTRYAIPMTTQHTDWNCDRSITGIGTVGSDVSGNGAKTQLTGPIDWNRLVYAGGGIGALAQPPGADDTLIDEPTPAELQANRDLLEHGSGPPIDPPAAASPKPRNDFTIGKLKGRTLTLSVPGAGAVELADAADASAGGATAAKKKKKLLKPSSTTAGGAGEVTIKLKLAKPAKQKLKRKHKVRVNAAITFTPTGGSANTLTAKLTVKK